MSDDQQEPSDQKPSKTRKIVRSASTAARPGFETTEGGGEAAPGEPKPEGGQAAGKKWDFRAERTGGPPPSRPRPSGPGAPRSGRPQGRADGPPRGDRPRPPRDRASYPGTQAEGAPEGGEASAEGGEARPPRGPRPPRDDFRPRRPGTSGGRAMPVYDRGPADRSSPEFIDKWLSMPPRKPEDRPFKKDGPRPEGAEGRPSDRPRDRGPDRVKKAAPAPLPKREAPPPPVQKVPTLHETILVGLPKVAVEGQRDKSANKPKTAKEALMAKTAHTAKPKAEAEEKQGEVIVDPSWVSVSADKAVATLKGAGGAAEALVEAWIQSKNVDAIGAASRSDDLSGAARKAARRAVNVLRSRGVNVPEGPAAAPAVKASEEEVVDATFNPPDGRGTSSMTIAKRRGGERAHIAEIIVREGVGVVNAVSGWMSRSQIKEAHQRIADSTGIAPASVPAEWVRWRVQKALEDNAKSGQLVPLGLERCKELLEPSVASEPAHPLSDLEASLGDVSAEISVGLHNEPEFRGWLPDMKAVEEVIRRVGAKLTEKDAGEQQKVDEILKEEMKLATDRYFTPEQRSVVARKMRDAAVTVKGRAGEEKAKEILRAAKAIESAGLITAPPSEIEFLRAFFQKGMSVLAQQTGGQLRVPVAGNNPNAG